MVCSRWSGRREYRITARLTCWVGRFFLFGEGREIREIKEFKEIKEVKEVERLG